MTDEIDATDIRRAKALYLGLHGPKRLLGNENAWTKYLPHVKIIRESDRLEYLQKENEALRRELAQDQLQIGDHRETEG